MKDPRATPPGTLIFPGLRNDAWWNESVYYQIYPLSFADSNGDGKGDLKGIESKLDYLGWLGVNTLWLSPVFASPMKDHGYDIADYYDIDPIFGNLADFDSLVESIHSKNIRIILDLVVNHCSDMCSWFLEAKKSRQSACHDWFIWSPGKKPPNNWKALFELKSAWHYNTHTDECYLGTFSHYQPEFNWRNRDIQREVYSIMDFWFARGTDGFRLDVATAYFKDSALRSNPFSFSAVPDFFQHHIYDRNQPEVHSIFRQMRTIADNAGSKVLLGETYSNEAALAASCLGDGTDQLHLAFNFAFLHQPWSGEKFKKAIIAWYQLLPEGSWPTFVLSNHDQPRHYFRYGKEGYAHQKARVAAAMLLLVRGVPFLYYGEEIGQSNEPVARRQLRDLIGIRTWPLAYIGRDPQRRPMQWTSGKNAGFGEGTPWLPVNSDWRNCNVEKQKQDPHSLLHWYHKLIALRNNTREFKEGDLCFWECDTRVMAFSRGGKYLVYLNFSPSMLNIVLPAAWSGSYPVVLSSHHPEGSSIKGHAAIQPFEVLVLMG